MLSILDVKKLLLWVLLVTPLFADAQERIALEEVVPALTGTDMGAIDIGEAPALGLSRVVSRSEVLSALRKANRSPKGLDIPRSTRITRRVRQISTEEFSELVRMPIQEKIQPCQIQQLRAPDRIVLPEGPIGVTAEARPPLQGRATLAVVLLEAGSRKIRVPVRVSLQCPPPIIQPGSRVRIIVKVGNVVASTPGEARQQGREQDIVHVTRQTDRAEIRARIVDSETVEMVNP
jgi:hypothetical protein